MTNDGIAGEALRSSYLASVSPATGTAGTTFTISGSGFGAVQGTGVVWLGSTLGAVVSWIDTQIVATVASNATSGAARVQQSGLFSNSVPFTVNTATITSVSPASGVAGTSVTITGSGFGAAQGTGQVWLGTLNGVVQSWSDTQVVALVASGSASANAQVLQNGVISNAIPFTVNTLQPTSISPSSGGVGTAVTFTGVGFGATQGSGVVWLGSTAGEVVSWSDTQLVATVAAGSVTGIARVQQNGVWSNAFGFTVPSSGGVGSATMLSPSLINTAVGDTHTIQASNAAGQPVTGLAWTTSDSTVVSLSTDDPPILTALAVGHVTITAGSASADVTVMAGPLALGTVLWSNPGDGSDVVQIIPAVPSATGVADVFAIQDDGTTVQAITSDGTTAWTANVDTAGYFADFQGGVVVWGPGSSGNGAITKYDGLTGLPYPTFEPGQFIDSLAIHPDGTIFAFLRDTSGNAFIVGVDPITGAQKFSVQEGTSAGNGGEYNFAYDGPFVAGDGYAYASYTYVTFDCSGDDCQNNHLNVLRIGSAGDSSDIAVAETTTTIFDISQLRSHAVFNNADQGVIALWQDQGQQFLATISGGSVSIGHGPTIPDEQAQVAPVLQAQDGSFVGIVFDNQANEYMVDFDLGGSVHWMVPNERPQIATASGGVIGQSGTTYDSGGNAIGQIPDLPTYSWLGYAYQDGFLSQVTASSFNSAGGFWAFLQANTSRNGAGRQEQWAQLDSCMDRTLSPRLTCPAPKEAIFTAWSWLIMRLNDSARTAALDSYVFQDATGNSRRAFIRYLGLGQTQSRAAGPEFYDGPRSTVKLSDAGCAVTGSVANEFGEDTCGISAITCRLDSTKPQRTFFEPRAIDISSSGPIDANTALEFHEALHGFLVKDDPALQQFLGCTMPVINGGTPDTRDITYYLQQFIGTQPLQGAPNTCLYIETHNIPANPNVCLR